MRIRYYCAYDRLNGYGRAARDYLAALDGVDGVELEIAVLGDRGCNSPEPRYAHLDRYAVPFDHTVGRADVAIYHAPPRVLEALLTRELKAESVRVALTTWETQPFPAAYVDALAKFDGVIVPSEFCAGVIERSDASTAATGIPYGSVRIVPHCFDEDFWEPLPEDARDNIAGARDDAFRFYSVGAWGERKNMLGVLKAYLHAFTKRDRTQLMLLIDGADFDEIRSVIARSGLTPDELPQLYVPDHQLSELELRELHAAADCFVSATRGEGFGLGLFEAAIMGREIITPMWGGQYDFLDDYAWAHPVSYSLTPCFGAETRGRVEERNGQLVQVSTVGLPPGVNCKQLWAEPDLEYLADAMRSVYEDRRPANHADLRAERDRLVSKFGYETVGPMLVQTLREIAAT